PGGKFAFVLCLFSFLHHPWRPLYLSDCDPARTLSPFESGPLRHGRLVFLLRPYFTLQNPRTRPALPGLGLNQSCCCRRLRPGIGFGPPLPDTKNSRSQPGVAAVSSPPCFSRSCVQARIARSSGTVWAKWVG